MRQLLWPLAFADADADAADLAAKLSGVEAAPPPPTLPKLPGDLDHRLRRVLRLRPGDALTVADGEGATVAATWQEAGLRAEAAIARRTRVTPTIWLAFSPLKGDRDDWLVEKVAEIGADRLLPIRCAHGVSARDAARDAGRVSRWQALCDAAFEQCGRSHRARVEAFVEIAALPLADAAGPIAWFVGDELGGDPLLTLASSPGRPSDAVAADAWPTPPRSIGLVVGPEGGLSSAERAWLADRGARRVSFGPEVLRAETAAVVGCGLLAAGRQFRA